MDMDLSLAGPEDRSILGYAFYSIGYGLYDTRDGHDDIVLDGRDGIEAGSIR